MSIYCGALDCANNEDGFCEAETLYMDENGVCENYCINYMDEEDEND